MEDKVTVSQIGMKYGIILGLVFIVVGMIIQFMNLDFEVMQKISYINYILLIAALVLAHKAFKDGGDGFMTFGQGLGTGMLISVISGVLSSVFSYIYIKFIDDSMLTQIYDAQVQKLEAQGMDDQQIENTMKIASKFMSAEMIPVWGILGMVVMGLIISLLVTLFTKKSNPALEV